ncbi:response regulator [Pannus brasiliensis CCIBt3594]|uniref:Response regulator n=1 Tax=Pannus brasiliensis CCIBt3594 TaxID=1427578 RepID=A0AAW9QR00_9CHRO
MERTKIILAVEDSDEDFAAFTRVLKDFPQNNISIRRARDGDEALDYLYYRGEYEDPARAPRPSLILLDLNLPGTDGREVIEEIKRDQELKKLPVVVLTTSSSPKDVQTCYSYGVNSYLIKPIGVEELKSTIRAFLNYWFAAVVLPDADLQH